MPKENTPKQQPAAVTPKITQQKSSSTAKKGGTRSNNSRVGGSAVPGAKSTMPKQAPATNNPSQQEAESYNRDMRRRMQHLGTGPYNEKQRANTPQEQRKRRLERRKQRLEEERERLRKSTPTGKIALGRRSTYFLIGVFVLVVVLIALFAILHLTHVIG